MFDKKTFSIILNKIVSYYETITEFAEQSTVGRSYISKYIHQKFDAPPSPKVLSKIADASKGITSYAELMEICGYAEKTKIPFDNNVLTLVLFKCNNDKLEPYSELLINKKLLEPLKQYFAFQSNDDTMAPLLNKNDIAIIEKDFPYISGKTYLLKYNEKYMIRKIIDVENGIELQAMNPYYPIIKTTIEQTTILGKVIRAEISSAFN